MANNFFPLKPSPLSGPPPNNPPFANPLGFVQGAQQAQGPAKKQSDQRFRSFAERYLVARASYFRQDPEGLAQDQWACVLDAKRIYAMIARTGQNIDPEDGVW